MKNKIIDNLIFIIGVFTILAFCICSKDIKIAALVAGAGLTLVGSCYLLKSDNTGYLLFSIGISLFFSILFYILEIFDKFKAITFMMCLSLALFMIVTLLFSFLSNKKVLKKYSIAVEGKVIDLVKNPNTTKEYYQPIYQYEYQNKSYIVSFPGFKNIFIPKIGDKLKIFLDPEDCMNVYFDKNIFEKLYKYGLCSFLMIVSIIIIVTLFI